MESNEVSEMIVQEFKKLTKEDYKEEMINAFLQILGDLDKRSDEEVITGLIDIVE